MKENFDTAVKNFIVDEEEYSKEKIAPLLEIIIKFCKVTKRGEVFILKETPTRKILKLILSARFIAHSVDPSIKDKLSKEELKAYSSLKDNVFNVRLSEGLKEHFIEEKDKLLSAKNILFIEQFLKKLEGKSEPK